VEGERAVTLALASGRSPIWLSRVLADYWALTKPDVNFLILITTAAGFFLAHSTRPVACPIVLLIHTLIGTLLLAGGTATLNQYAEQQFDAQMRRTKRRPVADGRITRLSALKFGIALSITGTVYLARAVNPLASLLGLITLFSYLLLYTPLKRRTPFCTLIGAFPGAVPPLIGWAAATGTLSADAWVLYLIVFLWQFPHFMAIAWMYREDYQRAGYLVLPRGEQKNSFMAWQTLIPSLGLIALNLALALFSREAVPITAVWLLMSILFLIYGRQLVMRKTAIAARRLLLASIIYLPLVFVLFMLRLI